MQQTERKYLKNILNADDADFSVGQDEVINSENVRFGSTDAGVINTIESVGSTELLSQIQPSVSTVVIGSADDTQNNRIIYFVADLYGNDDKIISYSLDSDQFYTLLLNSQVTGGLNFDKNSVIHSARVVNGLLFWTDFLNEPRRVNINAAINLNHPGTFPDVVPYTSPLTAESITVIRKPPVYPLTFDKITDVTIDTNQIKNNAFRFTYQYEYRFGERSTLAPHSLLAPYNYPSDTYNSIDISIPLTEVPDQDVQVISVIVIYAEGEQAFIIKRWDKSNSTDAAEIAAHVAGTTALSFDFANDEVGEAVDGATLVKLFDTVPLLSETLEQATNRIMLGRNLLGYNTPTVTSLTAAVVAQGATVNGNWYGIRVDYGELTIDGCEPGITPNWYLAYFPIAIDGSHPAGFYDLTADPLFWNDIFSFPTLPSTISIANYTWVGTNPSGDVLTYIYTYDGAKIPFPICSRSFLDSTAYDPVSTGGGGLTTNVNVLKSDSPYRLGVVFGDKYLRQCGIVAGPKITTPDRTYADPIYNYGIQWTLAGGVQAPEIPDWAYYYWVVSTKGLRASFFQQARAGDILYATKDADGNYVFTSTSYADSNAGVALKLDLLVGIGMGYSFQEGDIVKVYIQGSSDVHSLAVLAQSGEWVIGELVDLGSLASSNAFFEIYTPRPQTAAELYYEIGDVYAINNPTTDLRSYSVTSAFLPGDVYLLTRGTSPNDYVTENMSPNTTLWRNWFTNTGRQQFIDRIGQRFKETSVKWSNTFIPGTITNGLSTFDALDEKILPGEMGPLRKLQVTSKVNDEQGAVMLAICEDETASMYLGEVQLVGSAANAFVAQSSQVIGTVNILKGSFGTINPEGVTEFRGNVYWPDLQNGKIIQYSSGGLFPISNYKMTRFWKLFSDQFVSMTKQQIEDLGNRPFIFTTVDPHHWELLISIPKLLLIPPKGTLPDYPFKDYPFDIYDGQAKTVKFKLDAEPNHWQGAMKFCAEGFITMQNKLFSFKNGQLYLHNSLTSQCNFYGNQERAKIMLLSNMIPKVPKSYINMSIQANMKPVFTYMYADTPYQQSSDLIEDDFKNLEGIFYSKIYRNKLIPTANGYSINGLLTGQNMRTKALKILLEFDVSQEQLEFEFIDIEYSISQGHKTAKQ